MTKCLICDEKEVEPGSVTCKDCKIGWGRKV